MRDKNRIPRIISKLITIQDIEKNLSFCELINKVFKDNIFFYLEDDKAEKIIDDYITHINKSETQTDTQSFPTQTVLEMLESLWNMVYDWRLMQVIINVLGSEQGLMSCECDNKLVYQLIDYLKLS